MMTSTAKPDYWALLGLPADSNSDQLKRAFRREARKWHPDLNANDRRAEERFKLINEAYAVLSDPRKRSTWEANNQLNRDEEINSFAVGFPSFEEYLGVVLGLDTNDNSKEVIQEIEEESEHYDWPTTSPSPPPPVQAFDDLETLIRLTPEQALNGTIVELELENGSLVEVSTPPFAGDGWRLRLAGVAPGGRDHFLQLRVHTDEGLRIDGLRVLFRLELFPPDAVLGCAVDVPTLAGPVTLQVPPGSSSGRLLRLRGRGMEMDGRRGDQLVEIVVVIPAQLGDAELALYQRLQEISFESDSM